MVLIRLDPKSVQRVERDLRGRFVSVKNGTLMAMYNKANQVMEASFLQVPKDTEALAHSGYVEPPTYSGNEVSINFGYGGPYGLANPKTGEPTAKYAFIVHEDLNAHHPTGKAKYLEDPLNQYASDYLRQVGGDISKFFS